MGKTAGILRGTVSGTVGSVSFEVHSVDWPT